MAEEGDAANTVRTARRGQRMGAARATCGRVKAAHAAGQGQPTCMVSTAHKHSRGSAQAQQGRLAGAARPVCERGWVARKRTGAVHGRGGAAHGRCRGGSGAVAAG